MTAAWRLDLAAAPKLVLLAMCDWANDDGASLHPSVRAVSIRASMSERNAKRVLHNLIEAGWLSVVGNSGGGKPGTTRQYQLNATAIYRGSIDAPGDNLSRVTACHPTGDTQGKGGVTNGAETGDTRVTQTVIDPPEEPPRAKRRASASAASATPLDFSTWPAEPSPQVLADWLHQRRTCRAAVTSTVLANFGRELHRAAAMGFSVDDCLSKCCTRGWRGFEATWLERDLPTNPRNPGHGAPHASSHHRGSAENVEQLHQQYEAERRGRSGGGNGGGTADFVDADFTVVP